MQQPISRKKALAIVIGLFVGLIAVVSLMFFLTQSNENQFGKFIRIQNYTQKVKNLPGEMRDSMESSLYNTVVKNVDSEDTASRVGDAIIRDGSESQDYTQQTTVYDGSFIVDMKSIKQSYRIQYIYSDSNTRETGGSPVVVSCLPEDQLIYGPFNCVDLVSSQTTNTDSIMQYLPYENFSFKLSPDATQGDELIIIATLDIPQSDLKGNAASKREVVALYKGEVNDWFKSKGIDPTKYEIQYNYDDNGNIIRKTDHSYGD